MRGYWWSPDGSGARRRPRRHRAGPAVVPRRPGRSRRVAAESCRTPRPAHPTPTSRCTSSGLDGSVVDVEWDRGELPVPRRRALERSRAHRIRCSARDQRVVEVLRVDPAGGSTEVALRGPRRRWVELVAGVPRLLPDGTLVTCADRDGARRLLVDGEPVTPADLQVRSVATVDGPRHRLHRQPDRRRHLAPGLAPRRTTVRWCPSRTNPACTASPPAGGTIVVRTTTLAEPRAQWATLDGVELASYAATPSGAGRRPPLVRRRPPHRHGGAAPPRPRRLAAAGAARPLRRAPRPARRARPQRPPRIAVVRRPGLRRRRRRRSGYAGPRVGVGAGRPSRPRHARARRPDRRAAPRRRASTACSTCRVSPSAAGASAATSLPSPCSAVPTCSTPRSPARR